MGRLEVQLMVSFKSLFVVFKTQNWEAQERKERPSLGRLGGHKEI